ARDARHVPGSRYRRAHGRRHRSHPRRDVRVRLRSGRGGGRAPGSDLPRLPVDGRPRLAEGVLGRDPRRPGQSAGRHPGRPAARDRGRARRRVHLVWVPRRGGIRHHHPGATVQALRALRTPGAHRMRRAGGWLLAAGALTLPLWLQSPYHVHVAIMAGIFGVLALSLNLLLGYTGQLSLGHAAFFGIGAYATALLTVKLEWSPWIGLLAAIALPALAGWFIGRLALKIRGAYFVLLTISFAGVISLVSINWMDLTNGPLGLPGVPPLALALPALPELSLRTKSAYYYVVLATVALCYLVCLALVRSRVGRALVALRENETLAASVGIDVTHYLVVATIVSAAMAGLAGGLYAHYVRFVSPEVFLFTYT